jgi:hypothetical protein
MEKRQKGIVFLPILIIVLLIGVVGYFAYQNIKSSNYSFQNQVASPPTKPLEVEKSQKENQDTTDKNWGTKEEYTANWIDYYVDELGLSFKFLPRDTEQDCGKITINNKEVLITGCDYTIVHITKIPYNESNLLNWWSKQTNEPDSELLKTSGGILPPEQFEPIIIDNIEYRYAEFYEDLSTEGKKFGKDILKLKIKDEYKENEYTWYKNKQYYYVPHNEGLLKIVTGYSTNTDFLIESLKLH